MIPILYEADEKEFTSMGLGGLVDCTRCEVKEVLNGDYECTFDYPCNAPMFHEIKVGRIVFVSHDATKKINASYRQPFDIYAFSIGLDGVATFRARHVNYRLSKLVSLPMKFTAGHLTSSVLSKLVTGDVNGYYSMHRHLNRLPHGVTFTCGTYGKFPSYIKFSREGLFSVRSGLIGMEGSFADLTHCEFEWDKFMVRAWERRGKDTPAVIRFSHNLSAMTYEYDRSDMGQEIIPFCINPNASDNPDYPWTNSCTWDGDTTELYDGRIIWCEDCTPPYQGDYISFPRKLPRRNNDSTDTKTMYYAVPVDMTDVLGETPDDPEAFRDAVEERYRSNAMGSPYENISISFEPLWQTAEYQYVEDAERLVLGDTATLVYPEIGLKKAMRVVSVTWDCLQERYKAMEFGSVAQTIYTVNTNIGTQQVDDSDTTVIIDDLPEIDEIPIGEGDE